MNFAYPINTAWMWACRRSHRAFRAATTQVGKTQHLLLRSMVEANRSSDFGQKHGFPRIRDIDEFRARVPVADYERFQPWIERIVQGESGVLTCEPVRLLEPTSGSVTGRRLIPYTDSLQRQFQRGIDPWIANLLSRRPRLRRGRAYWMVTPPVNREVTPGGLEIGLADDSQYLGWFARRAAASVMAVPPGTMEKVSPEESPRRTMMQLLTVPDLTLISVWSPTFLATLVQVLSDARGDVVRELQSLGSNARRSATILESTQDLPETLARLWPRLTLISCWADGAAAGYLEKIHGLFPHVEIQPKGLISTEAFVSLPVLERGDHRPNGCALSVRSHFYEFQAVDADGDHTLLADELSVGESYRVIVTTGGGLYRYQTHDVVEVTGFLEQCPRVRFLGRDNRTCDLVGEKLNERFVSNAIARLTRQLGVTIDFAMIVPLRREPMGYCLLLEFAPACFRTPSVDEVEEALEPLLAENPYYDHAVRVGQLAPVTARIQPQSRGMWWRQYESQCLAAGMRRGDIKPTALETRFLWDQVLSACSHQP